MSKSNIFLLTIAALLIGLFIGNAGIQERITPDVVNIATGTVSIMVDTGDDSVVVYDNLPVAEDSTMFDVLRSLQSSDTLELTYEDYGPDMGVLITGIGDHINGANDNAYWQYWINNSYAIVGVSSQQLRPGDVILWKYVSSQL
jgi:hypothetical protein